MCLVFKLLCLSVAIFAPPSSVRFVKTASMTAYIDTLSPAKAKSVFRVFYLYRGFPGNF